MRYKLPNGALIVPGQAFTFNEIQYPGNWMELSTAEEKAALGITIIQEQPRPDDRFYIVTDNGDGTYSTQPKDLNELKDVWILDAKQYANRALMNTDWMVIRKVERNVDVPAEVSTYRAAVLAECDRLVTALTESADASALIAVVGSQAWPEA